MAPGFGGGHRQGMERALVIVTEADRIWARFTQVLPQVFPCVSSVTTWGPQALTTPEPISLYDRPSRDSYWLGAETRLQ